MNYFSRSVRLFFLGIALLSFVGCDSDQRAPLDLSSRVVLDPPVLESLSGPGIAIGIGSMITPKEGYVFYRDLIEYIEQRLGLRIQIVDVTSYTEMNRLLEEGRVAAAFVCGGPYVEGQQKFGLKLLAAPVVNGEMIYRSYLIVPADSQAQSFADLRGKTFAFADPKSNSGYMVPRYQLAQLGEDPDRYFSATLFTYGHDRSIRAVAEKAVDGAAVDSLIYEYLSSINPGLGRRTKVIGRSASYGIPPIVTGPGITPEQRAGLQEILLQVHLDPEGQTILRGMHIEKFATISDDAYTSIRDIGDFFAE